MERKEKSELIKSYVLFCESPIINEKLGDKLVKQCLIHLSDCLSVEQTKTLLNRLMGKGENDFLFIILKNKKSFVPAGHVSGFSELLEYICVVAKGGKPASFWLRRAMKRICCLSSTYELSEVIRECAYHPQLELLLIEAGMIEEKEVKIKRMTMGFA